MANLPSNDAFTELKQHANFNASATTLQQLMLKGEASDSWNNICEKVGILLATTRNTWNANDATTVFENVSISKRSVIGQWIDKINDSWDEAIKAIVPISQPIHLDSERMKERGKKVVELFGEGNNYVSWDNLVTKNVQLLTDQPNVQINFNEIELVYGSLGLELAMFLADVLIKYHQQLRLEHSIRYVTSDCARTFGRAFDSKINSNETDRKQFWAQISLLTGWEIIRRVTEDQELRAWSNQNDYDLMDVFQAGLRLVYNTHVDNIGFMITIALAEIF